MASSRSAANFFSFARWLVLLLLSALLSTALFAQKISQPTPDPKPTVRIDLSAINYSPPSHADRLSENESSVSLDFMDASHVLLTFDRKKLIHRLPTCTPDHQDRLMHAAILELPSGRVVKETDWYLHDRRRYLWPLGSGKFLLRKLNDLFIVDSALHETLLKHSTESLLWVAVTPDASQIVAETAVPVNRAAKGLTNNSKDSSPTSLARQERKFVAQFFDANSLVLQRTVPLDRLVNLDGTSAGYADVVRKGDVWLIRFGPTPARRRNIARVRSHSTPDLFYSSNNSLLVGRCAVHDCDYGVTAFTLTGHRLWQQHWSRYRTSPAVTRDEDHSRFGVSTLRLAIAPADHADEDDINQPGMFRTDVFQQEIQIFETASGNTVFSVDVTPGVLSGQNFSLSPDGRRVAVLQGSGLSLFDLPPISEEEKSKLSALKSDVSDLYTLAPNLSVADLDAVNPDSADSDATLSSSEDASTSANSADASASAEPVSADSSPEVGADNTTALEAAEHTDRASASPEPKNDSNALSPATNGNIPQSDNNPIATIRVSAKTVVVDVVVTDSKGHPVKGLSPKDFQLAEDGKIQDVRSFREFSEADAEVSATPTPPVTTQSALLSQALLSQSAKPSRNLFSNNTHAPEPGSVTLILFDLLNTPSQDQVYARQQLIKFLQSKPKGSQLALCTLSGGESRLRLIQGFTADETLLLAAAKGKKAMPRNAIWQASAAGTQNNVNVVADLARGGPMSGFQSLLSALQGMQAEQQETDTDQRVGITLDSVAQLSQYLSGIPGRKNVVWLSGSFPISIGGTGNARNLALRNPNYASKIRLVTNLLAEAQVAVYPVDVRGLLAGSLSVDTPGPLPASSGPPAFTARIMTPQSPPVPQGLEDLSQQTSERDTLAEFATATGGKAFYNTNDIREAIEIAVQQGSNYYSLSYDPSNKAYDGKFRKIKIALAEKGYTLHYRQGYFADEAHIPAKDAELARRTRTVAMQHGSPPSRQLLFSARVAPVGGKKNIARAKLSDVLVQSKKAAPLTPGTSSIEMQHYSIDYTFAGSELRFVPLPNASYRNMLMLMVTSFNGEGRMLTGLTNLGTSDLDPDSYKRVIGGDFSIHLEADIPAEAASMRLGVQDQMNNHLGTIEIPLPVPPAPNSVHRVRASLPQIEPD